MRWNIMAVLIGSLLTSIASAAEPTQAPPVVTAQAPAPAPTEFGRRDGIEFALGWPSVAVAYVHPLSERASITPRFDLIYGEEGTTNTRMGFGLSSQLEMAVARLNKFQLALHVEPGFRSYASQDGSGADLLLGFPVGATLGYQATNRLRVGLIGDAQMAVQVTHGGMFEIGPLVGFRADYAIDRLRVGADARFGPLFYSTGGNGDLSFRTQVLIGYQL